MSSARFGRVLLLVLALWIGSLGAAQMIPRQEVDSIDAAVLGAHRVVVGQVSELEAPSSSTGERSGTFAVSQVLKGSPVKSIRLSFSDWGRQLDPLQENQSKLLVFADADWRVGYRGWIDLDATDLAVPNADFTVITNPGKLIARVQEIVRRYPGVEGLPAFGVHPPPTFKRPSQVPNFSNDQFFYVRLPANEILDHWARNELASHDTIDMRVEALGALEALKSPRSIEFLKSLLHDWQYRVEIPAEENHGFEKHGFAVRGRAWTILKSWNVPATEPTFEQDVSRLDTVRQIRWFEHANVADLAKLKNAPKLERLDFNPSTLPPASIPLLAEIPNLHVLTAPRQGWHDGDLGSLRDLKQLRELQLEGNPITDAGLAELAAVPNLRSLRVFDTEVTDAGIAALKKARPNLNISPSNSITLIDDYAASGNIQGLQRILDLNPKAIEQPNRNHYGTRPLMEAVYAGQYETAKFLLSRGANVDGLNDWHATSFLVACVQPRTDIATLRLLVDHGADVNQRANGGLTPLMEAAGPISGANPDVVRFLLAVGADPWLKSDDGKLAIDSQDARKFPVARMVRDYMELRSHRPELIPAVGPPCPDSVYELTPKSSLSNWQSEPIGRLSGPVRWSRTPTGRDYLGGFGQQKVTFRIANLPKHGAVAVDIDLFILGSWDGNGDGAGPDILDISVPGVGTALHSTFFCNSEEDRTNLPMQSFPDPYPFGFHKAYTGAVEVKSLGYVERFPRSAVYRLHYVFKHTDPELGIVFTGLTVPQDYVKGLEGDEMWGIGGLRVSTGH